MSSSVLTATVDHWINGGPVTATPDTPTTDVYCPATGEVTKRVPAGSRTDAEAAVASAAAAFPTWWRPRHTSARGSCSPSATRCSPTSTGWPPSSATSTAR
nr:aldehyde dehydrogenase family protein [Gordonia sp. NB41Y]